MQNKFKGFRNFFKGKGYYIALLLCTVIVGVTGYYLLSEKEPGELSPIQSESRPGTTAPTQKGNTDKVDTDKPAANIGDEDTTEPTETTAAPKRFSLKKPVSGEVLSEIAVDHLAYNETTRDWRTHEGMDLAARLGEEVCAAADGVVYTVYRDEQLGMTVVLHHADGYSTHYSNLSEDVPVSVGDSLRAGDPLGTVGQTACIENGGEAHVHFALYRNNDPIDPRDFLS